MKPGIDPFKETENATVRIVAVEIVLNSSYIFEEHGLVTNALSPARTPVH
jgi:hypothetical protein